MLSLVFALGIAAAKVDQRPPVIAYSAAICWYEQDRRDALAEIAKQKKYAKIGGVFDKAMVYQMQKDIRQADERIPPLLASLRELKAKRLPCGNATVTELMECMPRWLTDVIDPAPPDHCYNKDHVAILQFLRDDSEEGQAAF